MMVPPETVHLEKNRTEVRVRWEGHSRINTASWGFNDWRPHANGLP